MPNIDRLTRFIKLLQDDAANPKGVKFDMSFWASTASGHKHSFRDGVQPTLDCGTKACALGLAAISGIFKDEGLDFIIEDYALQPIFDGKSEFEAGASFFEISNQDAFMLFDPAYYSHKLTRGEEAETEVVKRIQYLIDHGSLDNYYSH